MGLLSFRREFKDLARLEEIATILVKQGFRDLLHHAKLAHHAKLPAHLHQQRETSPERVRETLELLGPTFVKLGQVLSLRPDLIPPEYCEEFKKLQDDVAPLPYAVVKGILESELKRPLTKLFRHFDEKPLAAASVAQVHKATLPDGSKVVVKVQRPAIREKMARDIDLMAYIASRIDSSKHKGLHAGEIVQEFKRYTERELDLLSEMRNIKRFHEAFAEDPEVVIPAVYEALCTSNVLVMERIRGTRLSDRKLLLREGHDLKALARIGVRTIFKQVFSFGIFHGDPHPGNLLALKQRGKERLALLDFGIVGFVDEEQRGRFLDLLDATVRGDTRGVVRSLIHIGTPVRGCDPEELERRLSPILLEYKGATLKEEKMSLLVYKLIGIGIGGHVRIPPDVILLAKAFVTMEGAAYWLDPELNLTAEMAPLLKAYATERYGPKHLKEEAVKEAHELRDFVEDLPVAAEALIAKVKEGKLELALDGEEFRHAEAQYDLESSKRNLGLISAAFFVGSSLIAGLAAELVFVGIPLYQWGFALFLVTLAMLIHVSIKTHKYMERQV